jgi:hypothetical protein
MSVLVLYNWGMNILISNIAHVPRGSVRAPGIILTFLGPDFGYGTSIETQADFEYFSFIKLIRNLNNLIWFVVFSMLYLTAWFKLKEREL